MSTNATLRTLALASLLLAACTDHPTPGEPQFEAWPEVRGIITDGTEKGYAVIVDGSVGIKRTLNADTTTGGYVSAVAELALPYRVTGMTPSVAMPLVALAFDTGTVNVTPLSTLGASQAMSEYDLADINETRLLEAQGRMAQYLLETYGISVASPASNWAEIPLTAVDGDPSYEASKALAQALVDAGSSVTQLVEELAQQGSLCRQQKLTYGGSQSGVFCPSTRVATPDENDASIVTYSFIAQNNDSLVVVAQGATVTRADLFLVSGDVLSCTGCTGLPVGALGVAGERPLVFTTASLAGPRNITLTGTIVAPPAGVTLPPLYCTDRRFLLIKPDRTATGQCFTEFSGGAAFSGARISYYGFGDTFGYDLQTDAQNNVISFVYTEFDENFNQVPKFACELAGCVGISVGPLVIDKDWGATRRLTFTDARLAEAQADSTLSTTSFAVLNYSIVLLTLDGMEPNPIPDCTGRTDSVTATFSDNAPPFILCPAPNDPDNGMITRAAYLQEDGELAVYALDDNFNSVTINTNGPGFKDVLLQAGNSIGVTGQCFTTSCGDVSLSAPDGNGRRVMSFTNVPLKEPRLMGLKLTTGRTITLNGEIGDILPVPDGAPAMGGRTAGLLRPCGLAMAAQRLTCAHGFTTQPPPGRSGHPGASTRTYRGTAPR